MDNICDQVDNMGLGFLMTMVVMCTSAAQFSDWKQVDPGSL